MIWFAAKLPYLPNETMLRSVSVLASNSLIGVGEPVWYRLDDTDLIRRQLHNGMLVRPNIRMHG